MIADAPQVEYPLRLGSSAESVELALRLPLLLEFVLLIVVELEFSVVELVLVIVLLLIVVLVALPAVILVVVKDCPWMGVTKQSRQTDITLNDSSRIFFAGCCDDKMRKRSKRCTRNYGERQESSGFRSGIFVIIWHPGKQIADRLPISFLGTSMLL